MKFGFGTGQMLRRAWRDCDSGASREIIPMSFVTVLDQLPAARSPLLRRFAALLEPNDNPKFEAIAQAARTLTRQNFGRTMRMFAPLSLSNDCINNPTVDLRTLVPGRPVAFALTWGERTTTPGCAQPRTVVPAGSYRLMVRLDDLISPPTPFLRTPG